MTAVVSEVCLSVGLLLLAATSVATLVDLAVTDPSEGLLLLAATSVATSVDLAVTDPSESLLLVAAE